MSSDWRALSYEQWSETCDTLHAHTQVLGKLAVALLFVVYGVFYAIDEGQTKAYIADLTPTETRATAIGTYGFVTACVYLPASLGAGLLWKTVGPQATFGVAAGIALLALGYFLACGPRAPRPRTPTS